MEPTLRADMLRLTEELAELGRRRSACRQEQEQIGQREAQAKARLTLDVAAARDAAGKRLYPNEDTRYAALQSAMKDDPEYRKLRARSDAAHALAIELSDALWRPVERRFILAASAGVQMPARRPIPAPDVQSLSEQLDYLTTLVEGIADKLGVKPPGSG